MATLSERLRAEGMQEGRQIGEAAALKKLITLKFGELPEWAELQIDAAGLSQLEAWIEGVLDAQSVEELLGLSGRDA